MITLTKKAIEKSPLPQLKDLKAGDTFYLPNRPDRVDIVSSYDGDDFVGHREWLEGSGEAADRVFRDYIEIFHENQGKDTCTTSYTVVVHLSDFDVNLLHKLVAVVPVHCNVIYQETANFNI